MNVWSATVDGGCHHMGVDRKVQLLKRAVQMQLTDWS
jgi:hypothetical protein